MLATQSLFQPRPYAPPRSSPLIERSANACPRRYTSALMSHPSDSKENTPFSKRLVKQAPISKTREEVRDRRRDLFLKNVKKSRDDKNWEARGEQILRMDFMKEQKRWESNQARAAPTFEGLPEDEEDPDLPMFSSQVGPSSQTGFPGQILPNKTAEDAEAEAEKILRHEQEELDALLKMIEEEDASHNRERTSHFGSDDEDYDSLFAELLHKSDSGNTEYQTLDEDVMDIS